jgi:membrane associated rhomboid family serine protease
VASEPWRILSAVVVHGSILHIAMNMFGLVNLGRALEPHFRSSRFLILYVLSGFFGFTVTVWWRGSQAYSVGASGAIFGLLGAYIGALLIRRNPGWHRVLVSNLFLVLALAWFSSRIDHAAHVGGFVSGFLIGLVLELEPRPRRHDRVMAVLAGLCVVASLASIALSAQSPVWKMFREAEEARR